MTPVDLGGGGDPVIDALAGIAFPDIEPSLEYFWIPRAQQTVLDLANGSRQINETSPYLQREFTLRYGMETEGELWEVVMPHFEANRGGVFSFFDFWHIPHWVPVRVAFGDGATRTFTLPAKWTEGVVVRVEGDIISGVSLTPAGGEQGEDLITFTPAATPPPAAVITFTASRARRRFPVSYYGGANAPATIKPVPISGGLWGFEIQLIEDIASYG